MKGYQFCATVAAVAFGFRVVGAAEPRTLDDLRRVDDRRQQVLRQYLEPVLDMHGGAGRLYYRAACSTNLAEVMALPQLQLTAAAKDKHSLAAAKEIFATSHGVIISERPCGIISVHIGVISDAVLKTRLRELKLDSFQRYNSGDAISAIIGAPEVQATMHRLGIELPVAVFVGHFVDPADALSQPHLPALMKDLTADEALDRVATTFGGLVTYRECTSPNNSRWIYVDFVKISR